MQIPPRRKKFGQSVFFWALTMHSWAKNITLWQFLGQSYSKIQNRAPKQLRFIVKAFLFIHFFLFPNLCWQNESISCTNLRLDMMRTGLSIFDGFIPR